MISLNEKTLAISGGFVKGNLNWLNCHLGYILLQHYIGPIIVKPKTYPYNSNKQNNCFDKFIHKYTPNV